MTSSSPAPSTANGCANAMHGDDESRRNNEPRLEREENEEEDEDEEEGDVDFNPYLKETLSIEASSSLSSEVEVLDANVVDSGETDRSTNAPGSRQDLAGGDVEHGEEIVMQATGACEAPSRNNTPMRNKKRKSAAIYESGCTTIREKESGSGIATGAVDYVMVEEFSNVSHSKQLILDIDDEDAICKRTRARYSLASFSLDELENFLQETDDEEDLQNIDDEEEYRKFLAAVLLSGDGSSEAVEENDNVDEEDEDSDDDFELELEEALESDIDENLKDRTQEGDDEAVGRRPETRQKKLQKSTHRHKKKLSGQQNRPLRPILPYTPIPPSQALNGRNLMIDSVSDGLSSYAKSGSVNVFTPGQIGQLHCLIYEHVQLLIQVFSLCVFEPSRYHIANQVHGLLSEILQKREQVLSSKKVPYPTFFLSPLLIHPSRPNELPEFLPAQSTVESSASDAQGVCSSGNNMVLPPHANSPSKDRYQGVSSQRHDNLQTTGGFSWVPFISGPVLSVLDVAPLNLLGSYIDDVSIAVREYQRRHLAITCDASFEKECLFPFQFNALPESNDDLSRRTISQTSPLVSSSSNDRIPKKRTATALIDNVRKQSIAQVPKQIAKLAERFYPLFNPFLFPHKPPPSSVTNRILFTDAEDWLLARGLLKYNTDWKSIQENFLPCKTKHQIFVRQKNRSCSRAPENPIKAVRRMKTSPLTAEEKAQIQEGLKVFKLDWMSIWNCIVPHRDPSLLPRQWRVAIGTQTSYKADEEKKMKRRLKNSKPASLLQEKITDQLLDKQQNYVQKDSFSAVKDLSCNPLPSEVRRRKTSSGDKQQNYGHTDGHSAEEDDYNSCNHLASEVPRSQTSLEDKRRQHGQRDGSSANEAVGLIPCRPLPSEVPRNQSSSDKEEGGTDNAGGGNNSGDDCVDNEDEPYVHEAFLADWRPGSLSSGFPSTNLGGTPPIQPISHEGLHASSKRSQCPLISHQSAQPIAVLNNRPLEPNIRLRPYRARRTDKLRVVKLAPDLPPVNLPPSVRVMPQSAFSRYQDEIFGKISGAGSSGPVKVNAVLTSTCPAKSGMSHPTVSEQEKRTPVRCGTCNLDSQVSTFVRDNSQSKEKGDSGLNMHPLLFKTSENGSLPYYPLTCNTGVPSSFNFFPKSQHQVNLSPFHTPQQPNHSEIFSDSSVKSKGLNSPLLGIDFHPLLQRTADVDSNSVPAHSVGKLSSDAAGTHMAHQNPDDVVQTNFPDNSSSWTPQAISSSPVPRTNELDLDIHLSFTAREESSQKSWRMNKGNMAISTVGAGESEIKETQTISTSHLHPGSTMLPTLEGVSNSGVSSSVTTHCDVNRINLNNTGDSSLPDIVMEHEELSDSEEEENVEFECEEMTDSEREGGSDSDQIGNIHHEDVPDGSPTKLATEKNDNDQDEPRVCDMSRSENFGMLGTEKNDLNSILCLSLNPNPKPFASPTRAAIRNRAKLPVYRNWGGSQIDNSSKGSTLQQPNLVNISLNPSKKPSKRVPKRDFGAFKSQVRKRKSSTSTDPATEEGAPDTVKSIL